MPGGMVTASLDGEGIALGALTVTTSTSMLGSVVVGRDRHDGVDVHRHEHRRYGEWCAHRDRCQPIRGLRKEQRSVRRVTLAPAASCTFTVRLAPLSPGQKSALFQIPARPAAPSPNGSRHGPRAREPAHRPLSLEFGSVVVGQPSATLTATVINQGGVPSGALTETVTGGDFAVVTGGTCTGAMLAAGTTCTTIVQFTPSATGALAGQLDIAGAPGGTVW